MSNMKCPFCQKELDTNNYYVRCHNSYCNTTVEMEGTEELWAALVRTREALDVAIKCISWTVDTIYKGLYREDDIVGCCELSLERINEITKQEV